MLSSLNAFGGLSAANILTLFGANVPASPAPGSPSASAAQSAPAGVSAATASDPTAKIQAILGRARMDTSTGATATHATAAVAAYAAQMNSFSSGIIASEPTSSIGGAETSAAEQWRLGAAVKAAYAAVSASSANVPANSTISISARQRVGEGATAPMGGGLVVSVLGKAASVAAPGGSSAVASASATYLDPAAYQQIVAGGATRLAEGVYVAETGGSSALGGASVTLSLPDAAQRIAYALAQLNVEGPYTQTQSPTNPDVRNIGSVNVTAADAVNVTIANGAMAAAGGGALPSDLPSIADVQQAVDTLALSDPQSYPARNKLDLASYQGTLTLVRLPAGTNFAEGDNWITFSTIPFQTGGDNFENWALVLPQDTVTATVSDAKVTG